MKLTVEFPSVSYREGPPGVLRLARAIEQIGYDHIDMFDHVVMGYPIEGRPPGPYPAQMPILEALMALSYMAAVTSRVTLGTEVLVLPQRHPTLVAKQVSTLDTLSGGEQQMLAIARALMSNPRVLLMDEPSEGLAPQIVAEVMATIRRLKAQGLSILLVEQNAKLVFDVADDIVILNSGRVVVDAPAATLQADNVDLRQHLGIY